MVGAHVHPRPAAPTLAGTSAARLGDAGGARDACVLCAAAAHLDTGLPASDAPAPHPAAGPFAPARPPVRAAAQQARSHSWRSRGPPRG